MLMYLYQDEWHVATTGTPDASGEVNGSGQSFADLFWDTFSKMEGELWDSESAKQYCFWFELTSPLNRVVVDHRETKLTLLGARRVNTWEEVHPSKVAHLFPNIPVVEEYPLQSMEEILETFKTMNPLEHEGYVVVDAQFRRIKVKSPAYIALHHAKDGLSASVKNFVEIVRKGETSEWLSGFPELRARMDEITAKYEKLVASIEEDYLNHGHCGSQKEFALAIVGKTQCSAALFAIRAGKVKTVREYLATCSIDSLMSLLGFK